jgi:large subunit ribosomal protein L23
MLDSLISHELSWVLAKPRLTEKAAKIGSDNVYTFNVHPDANKIQITKAVKALYNVTPKKVATITYKPVVKLQRGRTKTARGYKKAMVFLKKGDTLDFLAGQQ